MASLATSIVIACFCSIILVINSDICIGNNNDLGEPEDLLKMLLNFDALNDTFRDLLEYYTIKVSIKQLKFFIIDLSYFTNQRLLRHV